MKVLIIQDDSKERLEKFALDLLDSGMEVYKEIRFKWSWGRVGFLYEIQLLDTGLVLY